MTKYFKVRAATEKDLTQVSDLLAASYSELMIRFYDEVLLRDALPKITRANPVLLTSGTYYLAQSKGGRIIGCGGWTQERPGTGEIIPNFAHIRHFATHPDWIGEGVGKAIFDQCKIQALAKGIRNFECYSSLNAEGFYTAMGLRRVRQVDVDMGEGLKFPSILMVTPDKTVEPFV